MLTSCHDIDECRSSFSNKCSRNATCHNTAGSYTCVCKNGLAGDGFTCGRKGELSLPMLYVSLRYFREREQILKGLSISIVKAELVQCLFAIYNKFIAKHLNQSN